MMDVEQNETKRFQHFTWIQRAMLGMFCKFFVSLCVSLQPSSRLNPHFSSEDGKKELAVQDFCSSCFSTPDLKDMANSKGGVGRAKSHLD